MTRIGIAPGWILVFGGAAVMLILLVQLGRRRRGRRVAGGIMLTLLALGGFALLLPATLRSRTASVYSQQAAARAQAEAMRKEALQQAAVSQFRLPQQPAEPQLPEQPGESDDADDAADTDQEAAAAADEAASTIESNLKIESTKAEIEPGGAIIVQGPDGVHVETNRSNKPGSVTSISQSHYTTRSRARPSGSQFVSSILLAGLVFAGYFFLNANTRGHYTWQLRLGSTLVFVASLAVVFVVGRHF